jgi:tricorn protease interacting factor F2/3
MIKSVTEDVISIKQIPYCSRFLPDLKKDVRSTWNVPIIMSTEDEYNAGLSRVVILDTDEELVYKWRNDSSDWIFINTGQTGFYRVLYSDEMIKNIIRLVQQNGSIYNSIDLAGIIENFFSLSYFGHMDMSDGLDLILALNDSRSNFP